MKDCDDCRHGDLKMSDEPCETCLRAMYEFKGRFPKWEHNLQSSTQTPIEEET